MPTQFETEFRANAQTKLDVWNDPNLTEQEKRRSFVSVGWYLDPARFANEAGSLWTTWIALARRNESDLKPWLSPIVVATGMQVLFTRVVLLWQSLPLVQGGLHQDVTNALNKEITTFVALVTK